MGRGRGRRRVRGRGRGRGGASRRDRGEEGNERTVARGLSFPTPDHHALHSRLREVAQDELRAVVIQHALTLRLRVARHARGDGTGRRLGDSARRFTNRGVASPITTTDLQKRRTATQSGKFCREKRGARARGRTAGLVVGVGWTAVTRTTSVSLSMRCCAAYRHARIDPGLSSAHTATRLRLGMLGTDALSAKLGSDAGK